MAKVKTTWFCKECGHEAAKWIGNCPSCQQWNTFTEEKVVKKSSSNVAWTRQDNQVKVLPKNIDDISQTRTQRIPVPDSELNEVLGGGIVPGSLVLLGGEPGIGKSTLLLQLSLQMEQTALYVSGEESEEQIKMRASRLNGTKNNCVVYTETRLENILKTLKENKPDWVIIDSIQTLYSLELESTPGSISQIKECTAQVLRYAKENNVPIFLIGHITKDGAIAGPKILEHMVDTVLHFEGDRNHAYRIVRSIKNRFGTTQNLGIYEMSSSGLLPVKNPSEVLLAQRQEGLSGIAIAAAMEGTRPLLVETQALVSTAVYGTPQRSVTGYDLRRLNMLLAVLEKRCGFRLGAFDVFINLAGGIRIDDPALDLAIMASIMSSYQNIGLPPKYVFGAEVGLSGEVRPIQRVEQRINEAEKIGFEHIILSKYTKIQDKPRGIKIHTFGRVDEVFEWLFG
ncbi:DNA repair protein RadA [Bacteroidia bacterium]|nr:DNA repair protein RadA [Bacteroidia bacterium]